MNKKRKLIDNRKGKTLTWHDEDTGHFTSPKDAEVASKGHYDNGGNKYKVSGGKIGSPAARKCGASSTAKNGTGGRGKEEFKCKDGTRVGSIKELSTEELVALSKQIQTRLQELEIESQLVDEAIKSRWKEIYS